ncbi:hypothetical protein AB0K87_35385, partial [Streptomyces sp. NPDC053705]
TSYNGKMVVSELHEVTRMNGPPGRGRRPQRGERSVEDLGGGAARTHASRPSYAMCRVAQRCYSLVTYGSVGLRVTQ